MRKFLITGNNFFNKLSLWSLLIFIGFLLGGCAQRNHLQIDSSDSHPSAAAIEYNNTRAFKTKHKAFYSQFKN